jgi:Cu+-exporting ATPase
LRESSTGATELRNDEGFREVLEFGDTVRRDSGEALSELNARGLRVALLTGDHVEVAERIPAETGVTEIHAGMSPEKKATWIKVQQGRGRRVLFVGDGVNDGPGLAAADVGLSMRHGAASSLLVADGVVAGGTLKSVVSALAAARESARAVRHNQVRSIAYNIVAVGAAAGGLINPLAAAILMPLSSAMVVVTALRVEPRLKKAGI